jgi:hypothetical protein
MEKDTLRAIEVIRDILKEFGRMYYTIRENDFVNTKHKELDKIINDNKEE